MAKKGARKKVEGKYDQYFLSDVIKESMKKEWGGQMISAGTAHEALLPANTLARAAITVVRKPYMFHEPVHETYMVFSPPLLPLALRCWPVKEPHVRFPHLSFALPIPFSYSL